MGSLEEYCHDLIQLKNYLCIKAQNHNHYKCYSQMKYIQKIREEKTLMLSRGDNWNDKIDRENFNSDLCECVNYGKCFSFSEEESVAMWMLYGGVSKESGMLDFTKKGMQAILKAPSVTVGYFKGECFTTVARLERNDFDIYITDIMYYKKNGAGYYITRSDESCKMLPSDIFQGITVSKKTYPWNYEKECRLIVSIRKDLLMKYDWNMLTHIMISIDNMDLGKSLNRFFHGPNYSGKETFGSSPSKLYNTIDWDLTK